MGDIKSAARVTNLVVTQEIIVARGSHAYMNDELLSLVCDHLA